MNDTNVFDKAVGTVAGWWTYVTQGGTELQATGNELDAQIANNAQDYAPGGRIYNKIVAERGQADADAAWAKVQGHLVDSKTNSVLDALVEAGTEGAKEGRKNLTKGIWKTFTDGVAIVPWPLWIAAGVGLFLFMGGGTWLAGRLKGSLSR